MRPTHLPESRRIAHEAAGEWPHPALSEVLRARVAETPDRIYLIEGVRDGGRQFTFAELDRRADRMAVALGRLGIGPGDVVSWQLPTWVEAPAMAVAISRIGAISNPILTIYREHEVGFACRQAEAKALIVPGEYRGVDHRELAASIAESTPTLEHVVTVRAEPGPGQRALESLEDDPPEPLPPSPLGPHDVAAIFYTSGTTADPKGVLHTSSTLGAVHWFHRRVFGDDPNDRGLIQFPLAHIGGITMFVWIPIANGSSVVFMDTFDPALAIDLIAEHQVTNAGGPPIILESMFAAPNFSTEKMASVRWSGSGAADVSPQLMARVEQQMDVTAQRSYGLTECPMTTTGRRDDPEHVRFDTDGAAVPGATVRLVDDDGRAAPVGTEGELEIFGAQLAVGYLDPSLNDAYTPDGYFRTGDLGVMDDRGCVRITGRKKDIIIRKGENVSAKAIEEILADHSGIADVAVIGLPDPATGERVVACIVPARDADAVDLADVQRHMTSRGVMRQMIPEQVELVEVLPRNATGKVQKHVLRARLLREADA